MCIGRAINNDNVVLLPQLPWTILQTCQLCMLSAFRFGWMSQANVRKAIFIMDKILNHIISKCRSCDPTTYCCTSRSVFSWLGFPKRPAIQISHVATRHHWRTCVECPGKYSFLPFVIIIVVVLAVTVTVVLVVSSSSIMNGQGMKVLKSKLASRILPEVNNTCAYSLINPKMQDFMVLTHHLQHTQWDSDRAQQRKLNPRLPHGLLGSGGTGSGHFSGQ